MITAKEANTGLARLVKRHKGETGPLKVSGQIQLILPELKVPDWLPAGEYDLEVWSTDGKTELYKNRMKAEGPAVEPEPEEPEGFAGFEGEETVARLQMELLNQIRQTSEQGVQQAREFYTAMATNNDKAYERQLAIEQTAREQQRQQFDEMLKMQRDESRRLIEEIRQQKSVTGVVEKDNTSEVLKTILPIIKEKGPSFIDALMQMAARRAMAGVPGAETAEDFADLVEATESAMGANG